MSLFSKQDPNPTILYIAEILVKSRVWGFELKPHVIPAKEGRAVKLSRYPEIDRLTTLDPRLRGCVAIRHPGQVPRFAMSFKTVGCEPGSRIG